MKPLRLLKDILAGNRAYVKKHGKTHRSIHAHGQKPPIGVVQCADSRVDLAVQANLRLGRVFSISINAGNVVDPKDPATKAAVAYLLNHLKTNPLFVVVGHYDCGGVKALDELRHLERDVADHLRRALPAKEFVDVQLNNMRVSEEDRHRLIVEANALLQASCLASMPLVKRAIRHSNSGLAVLICDVATGEIHEGTPTLRKFGLEAAARKEL